MKNLIKTIAITVSALTLAAGSSHAETFSYSVQEFSGDFELRTASNQLTTDSMQAQMGTFEGLTDAQISTSDIGTLFNAWRPMGNGSNPLNVTLGGEDWFSFFGDADTISTVNNFDLANQTAYFWGVSGAFPGSEAGFDGLDHIIIKGDNGTSNFTGDFPTGIIGPDPSTTSGEFTLEAVNDPAGSTLVGSFVSDGQDGGTYYMIPEPNAITLLLLGLGGTLLFRRRRAA